MDVSIPFRAKSLRDPVEKRPRNSAATAPLARSIAPPRHPLGGWFRRAAPTTFQRCLAVHMHFAQHPSALD